MSAEAAKLENIDPHADTFIEKLADAEQEKNEETSILSQESQGNRKVAENVRMHGVRPAAAHFRISRKNIQHWRHERLDYIKGRQRKHWKGQGQKLTYGKEVDDDILKWFLEKRDLQLAVSTETLKQHTKVETTKTKPGFKASDGWAQKFKRRHNLVMRARTSMAQKLPGDLHVESKVVSFRDEVHSIRSRTDMTTTCWGTWTRPLSSLTSFLGGPLKLGGGRQYEWTTGAEKQHLTVVLCCTANGDLLPPMIIFKGKTK